MKTTIVIAASTMLIAGAAFAATGGHGGHGTHAPSASGKLGSAKAVTRTVKLDASEYAFSATTLSFKTGETVKFVVTNKGKSKHELTIGTAEEQAAHQAEMEAMAGMKHDESSHEMPPNSLHVAPGETRELVWTFTKPGQLVFACNYPGHADLGMKGGIAVQ
jgi:uncharacterized cupredoxin-like copper-binding protein